MTRSGVAALIVSTTHSGVVMDSIVFMTHSGADTTLGVVSIHGTAILGITLMDLILMLSMIEDLEIIFS